MNLTSVTGRGRQQSLLSAGFTNFYSVNKSGGLMCSLLRSKGDHCDQVLVPPPISGSGAGLDNTNSQSDD